MSRNNMNYNDNIVRMEKKATNKFGIFLVLIIVIGLIGGTGYYLYTNKDKLDWSFELPWNRADKKNEDENDNDNNGTSGNTNNKDNNVVYEEPHLDSRIVEDNNNYTITISNLSKINLGYNIDISFESKAEPYKVTLEKILVDGFDTTTTFSRAIDGGDRISITVRINQTELDALSIKAFNSLTFYFRIENEIRGFEVKSYVVSTVKTFNNINELKGLSEIDDKNQTKIRYYRTIEDKDNTYIYFDFKNYSVARNQLVSIKKLLINGKLYEYSDFNEEIYHGAEKVVYLTIPKSEVKKVDNFTISFTMLNEVEGKKTAAYITNEYSKAV